jgi:hypothetical protein
MLQTVEDDFVVLNTKTDSYICGKNVDACRIEGSNSLRGWSKLFSQPKRKDS